MLSPYRVLDLTCERGLLCGQILADLGADVIAVEPLAGSSARRIGPWNEGDGAPDGARESLFWAAYARNKRSLALDLDEPAHREAWLELVAGADFLIESQPPGAMRARGLDYESLRGVQPGLVYVSITPFGQSGPKAGWAATDLTLIAAGGFGYLSGDAEGPPLRIRIPQAHAQAGADAAVGALIAHAERRRTGLGQHVDVSTQQSITLANMFRTLDTPIEAAPAQRVAGGLQAGGVLVPIRHRTRDGWVTLGPSILPSTGHFMRRLLTWVAEEGGCDPAWVDEDWNGFGLRLGAGRLPRDAYDPVAAALDAFFAERTRAEIMREAVDRKLLVAPVLGLEEILESEQLRAREFAVDAASGRGWRVPGPFARFEGAPIRYRRPAPALDEHGAEIRAEPARRPASTRGGPRGALPLEGVKVLDLFWVLAGPTATRTLADYGATVARVETSRHIDTLRMSPPFQFNQPHPEGGIGFQSANANKLGIALDLGREEGRAVALDLVAWADVVTESFAPGVMESWGLGWETLRAVRPDLVMISSCIMGQTGPWRDFAGFGRLAVSLAGFQLLASEPGKPPAGPFGAYTDAVASRYNAAAILAALEHRERTGEGQHIDLSQIEASLHFLAPGILDWSANRRPQGGAGNADEDYSPHGVYPAAGEDRWVAIAIRDDDDWRALCGVTGLSGGLDRLDRRADSAEVEAQLVAWTRERDAAEIEARLQGAGIPAHVVLDMPGLFADPQLQHRGHFIEIDHDIYPSTTVESSRLQLSHTPARQPERALSMGRDTETVLASLLGYSEERIAALREAGVLR